MYEPIYLLPRYKIYNKNDTPIIDSIYSKLLALPLYPTMKEDIPYIYGYLNKSIKAELKLLGVKSRQYSVPKCNKKENINE
jgi:hypothetical protein